MNRILTIAVLTVRSAIRSRIFSSLMVVAVLTSIVLPLTLRGDGSLNGYVRIAILYTLNVVVFLLAAATVWLAVRTSAIEIEERQMHLLVTKPVRCGHIWIGKWLGLLAMNAVLLAFAGTCTYGVLRWNLRPSRLTTDERRMVREEILVARTVVGPDARETDDLVRTRVQELVRQGGLDPAVHMDSLPPEMRLEIENRLNTISPGASRQWTFRLPYGKPPREPLFAKFRVSSPRQLDMKPVTVEWRMGPSTMAERPVYRRELFVGTSHSFEVLPAALQEDGLVTLEYVNTQTNPPAPVVFSREQGLSLLVHSGSFEGNLLRAMCVGLCKLGVLAALGLTMGSIFSMPVAVFVSFAVIVVFASGGFIHTVATDTSMAMYRPVASMTGLDPLMKTQFRLFDAVVQPFGRFDVMPLLPRGELIPWSRVGRCLLFLMLPYSGALALLGSSLLRRRELGMPSE